MIMMVVIAKMIMNVIAMMVVIVKMMSVIVMMEKSVSVEIIALVIQRIKKTKISS
jgi:hypothetical protein